MPLLLPAVACLLILLALLPLLRGGPGRRIFPALTLLLAGVVLLLSSTLQWRAHLRLHPPMDRSSIRARFDSLSIEGPQRQLVFHYTVENTTGNAFRIDPAACSLVSFRFLAREQAGLSRPQPDPALHLLEKSGQAYAQFTGLQRLAAANPAMNLNPCPLELKPRQSHAVAIAIPYAYPAARGESPGQDELRNYVRAFMPQIDGFGIADLARHYEIDFPRAW